MDNATLLAEQDSILEEKTNKTIEQQEEAQDLVILADSNSNGNAIINTEEELDPIIKAIRQEILLKQFNILKNYIAGNLDATVDKYDDQEFNNYLKNINNREIVNQIFLDPKVKSELEKVEIDGYKKVHHNFADRFQEINWQNSEEQGNIRSKIVKNDLGEQLATLKETTHKTSEIVCLTDGTNKQINSYRTIDLPVGLDSKIGPMHLSLAARDENGRNIPKERAVYFTAHYDSQGKLQEVSSPKPMKFNGEGDEAIGYIEHQGHIYTLPVTQGKYKEMLLALEQNKGLEVNLSQVVSVAPDLISTINNDVLHKTLTHDKLQYPKEQKKEAEEILQKISECYRLVKENAELIVDGLELSKKKNDSSNRLLLEEMAKQFQVIHGTTPEQAIIKYQKVLNDLSLTINSQNQEGKELQQFTEQNPVVIDKDVEKLTPNAIEYKKEQPSNQMNKVLQWFKQLTKADNNAEKMVKEANQIMLKVNKANQVANEEIKKLKVVVDRLPEDNPNKSKLTEFFKVLLKQEEKIKVDNLSQEKNETVEEHKPDKQINQTVKNVVQEQDIANSSCKTKTDQMIAKLTAGDHPLNKKSLEKTTKDSMLNSKTDITVPSLATAKIQLHKTSVNNR